MAGGASWERAFGMVSSVLFFLAVIVFILNLSREFSAVLVALLVSIPVYAAFLVWQWSSLESPEQFDWMNGPPLFRHIRHAAYFLCVGMVAAAWAWLSYRGRWRFSIWLAFWLAASMMLWSGSRGGFVAASVGALMLLIKFPLKDYFGGWMGLLGAVIAALLVSALFPVDQSGIGWLSAVLRSDQAESANQLSSGRLGIWSYLLPYIGERPWFGWGGEGFLAVWEGFSIRQAHNGVMQLLIEWGVIGAALVLIMISLLFFRGGLKYLRQGRAASDILGYGVAMLTALLVLSLSDGIFYYGMPITYLMIACACIAADLLREGGVIVAAVVPE